MARTLRGNAAAGKRARAVADAPPVKCPGNAGLYAGGARGQCSAMHSSLWRVFSPTLALILSHTASFAGDLPTTLGKRGKALLAEPFDGAAVPAGWVANMGELKVSEGALHAAEKSADKHIGAFRKSVELKDCAIQVRFKLNGARRLDLGFDPAPGELKKRGHLLSVSITPSGWTLIEHNDKANPQSKTVTHAQAKDTFAPDRWYTLLLELKGPQARASIEGMKPLTASAPDFAVKKPGLVFRMGTKDGEFLAVDEVKVWALE
jgi:hypothetical protein